MTTEMAVTRARLLHQELARFIEIVTQQMQPKCTILFSSLATDQIGAWSGLDLIVIVNPDLPFYEWIKQVLRSVRPQAGMDVPVYTPAEWAEMMSKRSFIQEESLGKGQVVYARER